MVLNSTARPLILGASTAGQSADDNRTQQFGALCRRAGLSCTLVGAGQRWRGFAWLKDHIYKPVLAKLHPESLVILTDVRDVIIQECSPDAVLARYRAITYNASQTVVSLETSCSVSWCPRLTTTRDAGIAGLHHVNGGFQMGPASALLRMWRAVRTRKGKNQADLGAYALANPGLVVADARQLLAATIVLDQGEWERHWMVENRTIRNRHSGVAPCFLHFPGTQEKRRANPKQASSRMARWDAVVRAVDGLVDGRLDRPLRNATNATTIQPVSHAVSALRVNERE